MRPTARVAIEADHEHGRAQPRHPVGAAAEQHGRPQHGGERGDGQGAGGVRAGAAAPQLDHADADERADRRGQGDRVVLVDDALAEAEGEPGDHEPAAPDERRGPGAVGAHGPDGEHQQGDQQDERGRQQPRDLAAERRVEQPGDAGRAPHRRPPPPPPAAGPTLPVSSPVSRPKPL